MQTRLTNSSAITDHRQLTPRRNSTCASRRAGLITAGLILGLATASAGWAGERVNSKLATVVRGVNGASCNANTFAQGSNPTVKLDQDVQNLSVNCDPGGADVNSVRAGLPQAHVCWARLENLEQRSGDIILETDPITGNPKHCLIRDITPNQLVKALNYKP